MVAATPQPGDVLDFQGFPGRWEILESSDDTEGGRFETRMRIDEPGQLPPHKHPKATESYEVVAGTLHVLAGDRWIELAPGQSHQVSPGTPHAFRTEGSVELINVHKPAMRYETYFRRFHALKVERGVEMPPRSFEGFVLLGMLQAAYEPEFIGVRPPQIVYRALAGIGRLLGYELADRR